MKLLLPDSILGPATFVDYQADQRPPADGLIVYVGGAISTKDYAARRVEEPTEVLRMLRAAGCGFPAVVVPNSPSVTGSLAECADVFRRHMTLEVLPAIASPIGCLGVVGHSHGAFLAALFAATTPIPVAAMAFVGGVGMAEGLADSPFGLGAVSSPIQVATNLQDPCRPHSSRLDEKLAGAGRPALVVLGSGGHEFRAYVDNGLLPGAVRFVATRLRSRLGESGCAVAVASVQCDETGTGGPRVV